VFLVYVLANGCVAFYVAALLVLAVADAFAALVGVRYGSIRYDVEGETKSLEGSLAVLVIAFLAIHLPLLLLTDLPRPICVLGALLVAALVTGFEAVSLGGIDNLFVPIGVCVILPKITSKPLSSVVYQNLSLLGIALFVCLIAARAGSFNFAGVLMVVLFAYGAWSLGSQLWALPIFLGLVAYASALHFLPIDGHTAPRLRVRVLFRAFLFPAGLIIVGNMHDAGRILYGPFLASLTTVLAFGLWNHLLRRRPRSPAWRLRGALVCALFSWVVVCGPAWLACRPTPAMAVLPSLLLAVPIAIVNDLLMGPDPRFDADHCWDAGRLILIALAAAAALALQATPFVPAWALP
jgi:phytol kinase